MFNFTWSWCEAILFEDSPNHQPICRVRLVRFGYIKQRFWPIFSVPLKVEVFQQNPGFLKTSFGFQHFSGADVEVGVWRIIVPVLWSTSTRFLPLIRPLLGFQSDLGQGTNTSSPWWISTKYFIPSSRKQSGSKIDQATIFQNLPPPENVEIYHGQASP